MKYCLIICLCYLSACKPAKPRATISHLDSTIAVRLKQWTLVPDHYRSISTVRTKMVLQVEWLTQQIQRQQKLAGEYQQAKDWKQAAQLQRKIQQQLQSVSDLLASQSNLVHHYEYLHTCRLQKLDGSEFQARYLIEADATDQVLAVYRRE